MGFLFLGLLSLVVTFFAAAFGLPYAASSWPPFVVVYLVPFGFVIGGAIAFFAFSSLGNGKEMAGLVYPLIGGVCYIGAIIGFFLAYIYWRTQNTSTVIVTPPTPAAVKSE